MDSSSKEDETHGGKKTSSEIKVGNKNKNQGYSATKLIKMPLAFNSNENTDMTRSRAGIQVTKSHQE